MTEPTKKLTLDEKIKRDIEDVEQQFNENDVETKKLQELLNQRLTLGVELRGKYKALNALIESPKEELSTESKED